MTEAANGISESREAAMQEAAEAVSLAYCTDAGPGIRRLRKGKLFDYRAPDGKRPGDRHMERIRALVIPPAWQDVWIAPRANCHIQATGRDERGRKQYRYHERWSASRDEVKFGNLVEFATALPKLRKAVEADLRKRGMVRDKVLATVIWLLDNTLIRVGNDAYARDNKSFGLTTLRNRHVEVRGAKLKLAFKGKSGKEWERTVSDQRIARIVNAVQDLPGQHLFQYVDEDGGRHAVTSTDVNDYIRARGSAAFSSKHFRTWSATVLAATGFAAEAVPETKSATNRVRNAVIDTVAAQLGNTRSVCRKCYIHPQVFEAWEDGKLAPALRKARLARTSGLSRDEAMVLRWLRA